MATTEMTMKFKHTQDYIEELEKEIDDINYSIKKGWVSCGEKEKLEFILDDLYSELEYELGYCNEHEYDYDCSETNESNESKKKRREKY